MAYTRTDDPRAALMQLADAVPVVVITCGGQGAIGVDSTTGEEEWVPSLPVNAVDATGAGDVFAAAFVVGTLRDWPLRTRMAFANLCAALSVQQVGGSLAAPGWGDLVRLAEQGQGAGRRRIPRRLGAAAQLPVPRGRAAEGPEPGGPPGHRHHRPRCPTPDSGSCRTSNAELADRLVGQRSRFGGDAVILVRSQHH